MTSLRLFDQHEEPKKLNWKKEYVNALYRIFEEEKKQRLKVPYGALMGYITKISESVPSDKNNFYGWAWVEGSGEIIFEYPPIEEWENQFRAFLSNDFASKANYPMPLFFKQYGNFEIIKEPVPLKTKPAVKKSRVKIYCSNCKSNHWSDERCEEKNFL